MTAVLQTTRTDVNIVGTPECFVVMRRLSLCNFHKMSTLSAAQNWGTPVYFTTHFFPTFPHDFCLVASAPVLNMVAVEIITCLSGIVQPV